MRWLKGFAAAVFFAGMLWLAVGDAIVTPDEYVDVESYCAYGAVSQPQYNGCVEHVSASDIAGRHTNAAMYATGRLDKCLADAGPVCGTSPSEFDFSSGFDFSADDFNFD